MADKPLSDLLPPAPSQRPELAALLEPAEVRPGLIILLDDSEETSVRVPRKGKPHGR